MTKTKKSKFGFTLVELMVAALAFSILSLAVGSMLVYGWQGWKRSNDLVAMQRDASLAMMMISKEIRNATFDEIHDTSELPGIISFDGSGISFDGSGNNIVRNDGMVVVNGWLVPESFTATKQGNNQWIKVDFTLNTTTDTETYSIKVAPRN